MLFLFYNCCNLKYQQIYLIKSCDNLYFIYGFFQLNSIKNSKNKSHDLIFSSTQNIYNDLSLDPVVPLDLLHSALDITINTSLSSLPPSNSHSFFDYNNAQYNNIHNFLSSFNWELTLSLILIQLSTLFMMPYINVS